MLNDFLMILGIVTYGAIVACGFIHIFDKADPNMRFKVTYLDLIILIVGLPFTILGLVIYYGIELMVKLCDIGTGISKSTNKFIQRLNQPIIKEKGRN